MKVRTRNCVFNGIVGKENVTITPCTRSQTLNEKTSYKKNSYPWVYYLKGMDNASNCLFEDTSLIIMRASCTQLKNMSWEAMVNRSGKECPKNYIQRIIVLPRPYKSMMYAIHGLHQSVHFSLGPNGVKTLINEVADKFHIPVLTVTNYSNELQNTMMYSSSSNEVERSSLFVKTSSNTQVSQIETKYHNSMKVVAEHIFPILFESETCTGNFRSSNVLNLGVTNQKCHKYKRCSIGGRVHLDLIDTSTKKMNMNSTTLKAIAKLLLEVSRDYLPYLGKKDLFKCACKHEKMVVSKFAKQLLLTNEKDIEDFCIPAISLLINKDLNPHCDDMNPTEWNEDVTFSISVQLALSELSLPKKLSTILTNLYGDRIPFCLVVYKRKTLVWWSKRMRSIDEYLNKDHHSKEAELNCKKFVSNMQAVNTELDYVGYVYNEDRYKVFSATFKSNPEMLYQATSEAIDKMGFWSSLLHLYYLYVLKFGWTMEDSVHFVLFFSNQCNTTTTIVEALQNILTMSSNTTSRYKFRQVSLYRMLAMECLKVKLKNNNKDDKKDYSNTDINKRLEDSKDVGSGPENRFMPSRGSIYSEKQLELCTRYLLELYSDMQRKMSSLGPSQTFQKTIIVRDLLEHIAVHGKKSTPKTNPLEGISHVRGMHLIQLSSLLGLLSLDFYIYTPIHHNGGPGKFMTSIGKSSTKGDELIRWVDKEMTQLVDMFGTQLTQNMYENLTCIVARTKKKKDLYYSLPRWDSSIKDITDCKEMQLCFRVEGGHKEKDFILVAYNGTKKYQILGPMIGRSSLCEPIITLSRNGHKVSCDVNIKQLQNMFVGTT